MSDLDYDALVRTVDYEDMLLHGFESVDLRRENQRLRDENQRLQARATEADRYQSLYENALLRCADLNRKLKRRG